MNQVHRPPTTERERERERDYRPPPLHWRFPIYLRFPISSFSTISTPRPTNFYVFFPQTKRRARKTWNDFSRLFRVHSKNNLKKYEADFAKPIVKKYVSLAVLRESREEFSRLVLNWMYKLINCILFEFFFLTQASVRFDPSWEFALGSPRLAPTTDPHVMRRLDYVCYVSLRIRLEFFFFFFIRYLFVRNKEKLWLNFSEFADGQCDK